MAGRVKTSGIYGIKNLANGKWYVGQSCDLTARRRKHLWELRKGNHDNSHLQRACLKHGMDNFEFRMIEEVPENMLDIRERAWIAYYRSTDQTFGYNIESGGNLLKHLSEDTLLKRKNHHPSEETRRRMSEAHSGKNNHWYGKHLPAEARKKMSKAKKGPKHPNYGKHHSEETRRKISEANSGSKNFQYGKHRPAEIRRKISEARKGMVFSAEHSKHI